MSWNVYYYDEDPMLNVMGAATIDDEEDDVNATAVARPTIDPPIIMTS